VNPVWLLAAGDFTPLGGMDQANYAMARHLAGTGAEVHLVSHRVWPDLAASPHVTVHRVPRPFNRHALGAPLLSARSQRVHRQLQSRSVRVLVNGGNCRLSGGANWVHYVHSAFEPRVTGPLWRRSTRRYLHRRDLAAERAALDRAHVVICNSERTRRDIIERLGVPGTRVRVVYYGADPVRLAPSDAAQRRTARVALGSDPERPLMAFVGALGDHRKAFDTVFTAWANLCRRAAWDADLVVLGHGPELPLWQRRAADAGLTSRIRFLGFRSDVPELMAAFDGLVHPARYEAYGLAVHEALCRAVPALVSASAGVAERYPEELRNLLIDDPDDPDELTERLSLWRDQLPDFRTRVTALSATLRRRTWDAMAADIVHCVSTSSC
jgi:glycosyltransferase involved in cell wall biosynthesis